MKSPIKPVVLLLILMCMTGCSLLYKNSIDPILRLEKNINKNDLLTSYDIYEKLSKQEKSSPSVKKLHRALQQKVRVIRNRTVEDANLAISQGDWKRAGDLYHAQMALIDLNPEFRKSYQQFQQDLDLKKKPLSSDFLLAKAQYLVKKLQMEAEIHRLDPYDEDNETQLRASQKEAKRLSKQLLALGLKAVRTRDVATARQLIPLAQTLADNKSSRKAAQTLEKLTQPMEEYIEALSDRGTSLYSSEDYEGALEMWMEVLYLDPNNKKIQANKERTEKVLHSLDRIMQENKEQTSPELD